MAMLVLILLAFAFVLFVLDGLSIPPVTGRLRLVGLGLALWVLAELLLRASGVPLVR